MIATPTKSDISEEEFLAMWAVTFGYEWVEWLDAMAFKESIVGRHSIQIYDLLEEGKMEKDDESEYDHTVRLIRRVSNE